MDFYSTQWLTHCHFEFPRKIGFVKDPSPRRKKEIIQTQEEFLHEMWTHVSDLDLYVAVFSERQKEQQRYDTIYMDLDCKELDEAHADMQTIYTYYRDTYELLVRIYFSGSKGFHIYVDFPEVSFANYKGCVSQYVKELERYLGLSTVDWSVIGDAERISALPYTKHTETGLTRIPINPEWSLDRILGNAQNGKDPSIPITFHHSMDFHRTLQDLIRNYREPPPPKPLKIDMQNGAKDLVYILQHAHKFEGVHRLLWTKIIPLFKVKGDLEGLLNYAQQVCALAQIMWTYDLENYVRSNYLCDRGIPWSWGKIKEEYPEVMRWFDK